MERPSYVYMLASAPYGTLHIGATMDLIRRVWQHREKVIPGFTSKYGVLRLVWFEVHSDLREAALRERRLKKWNRAWKIELINKDNPRWDDLYPGLL
ncbi:MAG: GIY-YIG nuclease family protein [Massilia sp.]